MPPINAMQANAGFMPYGTPDMPPLVFPMGAPIGPVASPGQVSAMLQQQMYAQQYVAPPPTMMMGGTTMQSPFRGGFGGPPSMFGRANMAREAGISAAGTALGGAEAGMTALSMAAGFIPGIGVPLGLGIDALSSATFGAVGAQRERALTLQNQSLGYVFGGGMMSQTGQGMGMQQARMITSGIGRMADSASFKQETGGMLNRADLDRLTRIAGETGMLNNTQSPQQVLDTVRKISKQVTTFMSVLEEPDFQKAMQRVGELHRIGVRLGDMSTVATNTRTFARMAGVTADQAMGTAIQHAQAFQQQGLSAANGINASLGAQGFGRQIASVLDNRTLSMMGGVEGVQNNLMQTTTNTFANPLLMASVLSRGANGRLHASGRDFLEAISGPNASISDITRRGASNMRGLGGRRAISEVLSNQNHLRDEMMDELSPEQMMLVNIRMAQLQQRQAGGSLEENVMRMTGSEEQTRTLMTLVRDPRAMAAIREQGRIAGRDRAVGRRDRQLENQSHWLQRGFDELTAPIRHEVSGFTDSIGRWSARNQERAESLALQGSGRARALDGDNFTTDVFTASVRDEIGAISRGERAGRGAGLTREVHRRVNEENMRNATSMRGDMAGARGFGFTASQRGGDSLRQTVLDGGSFEQRLADSFIGARTGLGGRRATPEEIQRMANSQMALGETLRRSRGDNDSLAAASTSALNVLGAGNQEAARNALNTASNAAHRYFSQREGMFGTARSLDENGMIRAARTALTQSGVSRADADRMLASQDFRTSMAESVRSTGSAAAIRALDRAETQSGTTRDHLAGQTSSALRDIVSGERNALRSTLGLSGGPFGFGQAGDQDVGRLSDLLTDTNDHDTDELRRKLFTAYAMSQSEDRATAERGRNEFQSLKQNGGRKARDLANSVQRQFNEMDEGARRDLAEQYSGRSVSEASQITARATHHLNRAKEATARVALTDVLGAAGAEAFEAGDINRLRENAGGIRNRRVHRMVEDGKSMQEIRAVVESAASEAAGAASRSGSAGAGEDGTGTEEATDTLVSDIQAGLESFPEATENLNNAATALRDASRALQGALEGAGIDAAISRAG